MYHYTDVDGYKAISSQPDWRFKASKPPGPHPVGAYFTAVPPDAFRLCSKLLIPRRKVECVFEFSGGDDLQAIEGDPGLHGHSRYSRSDYVVPRAGGRQIYDGRSDQYPVDGGE